MRVLKTRGKVGVDGRLRLELPVELPAGPVELVLAAPHPEATERNTTCRTSSDNSSGQAMLFGNRETSAMSGERYLLDTNAIVALLRPASPVVSAVVETAANIERNRAPYGQKSKFVRQSVCQQCVKDLLK